MSEAPMGSGTSPEPAGVQSPPSVVRRRIGIGTLLVVLLLVNGILLDRVQNRFAPRWLAQSTLENLERLYTRPLGADSWAPMHKALDSRLVPERGGMYRQIFFDRHIKFQYPPSSLFPVMALDWLRGPGLREHQRDWLLNRVTEGFYLATIALTVWLLDFRLRTEARRAGKSLARGQRILAAIGAAGLTALFFPLLRGVTLGQIQPWIDALFAGSLLLFLVRAEALAGIALGLTVWLKPQYGLLLVWGVLRRRWRFSIAFAGTAAVGAIWALAVFGLSEHLDYLKVLSVLAHQGESYFPNNSVNGLLHRLAGIGNPDVANDFTGTTFLPPYVPWIYVATLLSSLAILVYGFWRMRGAGTVARTADLAAVTLAATMASPIAWSHHYGILAPIFALLVASAWGGSRGVRPGWLLAAYLLSASCFAFTLHLAATPWNFLESHLYAGAWIVLVLLVRLRNESAPEPGIRGETIPAAAAGLTVAPVASRA
ncbi:MAG: glycosyltransferase family 87 protein [Thermoanaerobaculia bacterium]